MEPVHEDDVDMLPSTNLAISIEMLSDMLTESHVLLSIDCDEGVEAVPMTLYRTCTQLQLRHGSI